MANPNSGYCPPELADEYKRQTGLDWQYKTIRPMCEFDDFAFGAPRNGYDDDETFVETEEKF